MTVAFIAGTWSIPFSPLARNVQILAHSVIEDGQQPPHCHARLPLDHVEARSVNLGHGRQEAHPLCATRAWISEALTLPQTDPSVHSPRVGHQGHGGESRSLFAGTVPRRHTVGNARDTGESAIVPRPAGTRRRTDHDI